MQFMWPQNQFTQPQQQQYDFSGWGDRLTKIEEGIASLTNQFNSFQKPGDVAPEYQGNAAPEPFPILPDIDTIASPGPIMGEGSQTQIGGPAEIISGPGIISPMEPPGGPSVPIGGPGIIDPNFSPYQRNENLDLTNRAGIMSEYSKYIQGGMGSRAHTADMATGYSFMGEDMAPGSSTGFSDFRKFLNTYGIGDRLQNDPGQLLSAQPSVGGQGITSLANYQSQQNTGPGI